MFFRRMFRRKDSGTDDLDDTDENDNDKNWRDYEHHNNHNGYMHRQSEENLLRKIGGAATAPPATTGMSARYAASNGAATTYRGSTSSGVMSTNSASMQLTPLWEHILRTRTLPDSVCPSKMFLEFHERLKDPEWQVRQHALRVFVDVLVVMRARADSFMEPLIPQLVENLGHPAPTVRKGALDCLRVYLSETGMPETVMLQILDIGLNQKITNEPFGGRLTCGVMLSLPALVQSILHTNKRRYILRTTIDMLGQKMGQVTHQEITLKVLSKIRDLLGKEEFMEFMSHSAYHEFELLCNVYGVGSSSNDNANGKASSGNKKTGSIGSWHYISQQAPQTCWRSSDEEQMLDCATRAKVIMETEIKINDDTLTMRILEAKDEEDEEDDDNIDFAFEKKTEAEVRNKAQDTYPNSLEDDVVCGRLASAKSEHDIAGVVQVLSDSEIEEANPRHYQNTNEYRTVVVTPSTPSRTPKRVTFGGEIVKMRTPDSDATTSSNTNSTNNNNNDSKNNEDQSNGISKSASDNPQSEEPIVIDLLETSTDSNSCNPRPNSSSKLSSDSRTTALTLQITNDNTKPLTPSTPRKAQSPRHEFKPPSIKQLNEVCSPTTNSSTTNPSPQPTMVKRSNSTTSLSPRSPFRRLSVSPVDSIISPKTQHKQIEVLHNLQRDPSPIRAKSAKSSTTEAADPKSFNEKAKEVEQPPKPKSWEELEIVDDFAVDNLRSGDWRHRFQGIIELDTALRSSENLAKVQPCLDSLLRTLLSSERKAEVSEAKRSLIINLIGRLPLDNLEDRTLQIMTGLCRQGGAGANRVCKALMQRLPPAAIVLKLISQEFLHAKSSRFREHALQMVMYALMTFPSTCFDTKTCITSATYAALNRKKRVRQAALDVLAILGQVTSARNVMDIVQSIVEKRDDSPLFLAGVKARLARKQLPIIHPDGLVQYSLRLNSPQSLDGNGQLGPDVEWIKAGIGSVSPTSIKRRAHRMRSSSQQSFRCLPQQGVAIPIHEINFSDDSCAKNAFGKTMPDFNSDNQSYKLQHVLGNNLSLTSRKTNLDYSSYNNRRMVAKSCSDSSMDGRSSDSTYTSSSGGGGSGAGGGGAGSGVGVGEGNATNGISGRFTRQPIRFPSMDLNATFVRVHKPPTHYPGMGAYAHLQQQQYNMSSTYPKINYSSITQQRRRSQQQPQTQQQPLLLHQHTQNYRNNQVYQQQHFNQKSNCSPQESFKQLDETRIQELNNRNDDSLDGTYTICSGMPSNSGNTTTTMKQEAPHQHHQQQQQTQDGGSTARRFVNVEKLIQQNGNKIQKLLETTNASEESEQPSAIQQVSTNSAPNSAKSMASYSQKSTASAKTASGESEVDTPNDSHKRSDGRTASMDSTDHAIVMVMSKDNEDEEEVDDSSPIKESIDVSIPRSASVVSLQSKAESIQTQLDPTTPPPLSRAQSMKSVVIEEEIEISSSVALVTNDGNDVDSFVLVEEEVTLEDSTTTAMAEDSTESGLDSSPVKSATGDEGASMPNTAGSVTSRPTSSTRARSPSIAELKALSRRNSMIKSMESLYERPASRNDYVDNTTEETSSQSSNAMNPPAACATVIPPKVQHTPLKQKSKTSHFLRSHRRVSPVKQSIQTQQAELFPASLGRFEKPREALHKTFDNLDSPEWETIILGLKSMVRLMRHHTDHLEAQMHMVCIQLTRSVRNLRSQVARAACQASRELFSLKSKALEQECDDLICALLHRSADTNRFLRADATCALESMCDNLSHTKVLNLLTSKGATHQNSLVRTTTAKLLNRLAIRLGHEKVFALAAEHRNKFFVTGANLLLEGSLDTRNYAKALFRFLSQHPSYNRLLLEVIPQRTYRNVEKALRSIRC